MKNVIFYKMVHESTNKSEDPSDMRTDGKYVFFALNASHFNIWSILIPLGLIYSHKLLSPFLSWSLLSLPKNGPQLIYLLFYRHNIFPRCRFSCISEVQISFTLSKFLTNPISSCKGSSGIEMF